MIQDTLQRLRGQSTTTAHRSVGTELSADQAQALASILTALDEPGSREPGSRRAIGLFGPPGSGKTTLLNELCKDGIRARRTPHHRRVVCATINAANLPADLAPWQRLIFGTLDKLAQQPGAPATVHDLRAELEEVVQHEAHGDESATLAAAAFAHHMRAAFAGLIHSAITLANATFVVAIDHLDKAEPAAIAQLLEASRYFLNAQHCTTMIIADEAALVAKLDDPQALHTWLTGRVELHTRYEGERLQTPTRLAPSAEAQTQKTEPHAAFAGMPQACMHILSEALGNDQRAIERAAEHWRAAMRALARRNAEGYHTDVSGAMIAKLCALRVLSPSTFDAVRFDAPALTTLERRARLQSPGFESRDEWAEALMRDPKLAHLFRMAPSFIGVETRHLATAVRLIQSGDAEPTPAPTTLAPATLAPATIAPAQSTAASTRRSTPTLDAHAAHATALPHSAAPRAARAQPTPLLPPTLWPLISVAAITFIVDRLTKMLVQSMPGFQSGTTVFGPLFRLQPPPAADLIANGALIAAELIGLALCILIVWFSAREMGETRAKAFGLIAGGLVANAFDHVANGAPLNFVRIATLPAFNFAHLALLVGALLLIIAMLTEKSEDRRNAGGADYE